MGNVTLMCGDGTNDVGALKEAHVGVNLMNAEEVQDKEIDEINHIDECTIEPVKLSRSRRLKLGLTEKQITQLEQMEKQFIVFKKSINSRHNTIRFYLCKAYLKSIKKVEEKFINASFNKKNSMFGALLDNEQDEENEIHIGDSSIAAPFSFRGDSINCVTTLMLTGKAALVRVIMSYKMMALNSLVTAFSLSVLTMYGVKFGSNQMTAESFFFMALNLNITFARSGKTLTHDRPTDRLLSLSFFLNIALQSLTHMISFMLGIKLALAYSNYYHGNDGPFAPNLLNTVTVIIGLGQHIANTIANYEGAPFMQSWKTFYTLILSTIACIFTLLAIVFQVFPYFNMLIQLVHIPKGCRTKLLAIILANIIIASFVGQFFMSLGRYKRLIDQKNRLKSIE